MKLRALVPALLLACAAFAGDLVFEPATVQLGAMMQGDSKKVSVSVLNASKKPLKFVDCVAQGRGPRNISWPRELKPGQRANLAFDFVADGLNGLLSEHVTLVSEGEQTHPLLLEGSVTAPVELWPAMPDFGFVDDRGAETTLYAFSLVDPAMKLAFDPSQEGGLFAAKIEPVKLDTAGYPERLVESKKGIPGYRIRLKVDPKAWPAGRQSLGALGRFTSPQFPKATIEFYAVGYRKK